MSITPLVHSTCLRALHSLELWARPLTRDNDALILHTTLSVKIFSVITLPALKLLSLNHGFEKNRENQ